MMSKKLLIVDDHGDLRRMLRMVLGYGKYIMHEAADGDHALHLIEQERPDVILLDVMLQGQIDGFEVCRRIRSSTGVAGYDPYVILVTGRSLPEDIEEGRAAGADAYVVKPFTSSEIIGVIEAVREPGSGMRVFRDYSVPFSLAV